MKIITTSIWRGTERRIIEFHAERDGANILPTKGKFLKGFLSPENAKNRADQIFLTMAQEGIEGLNIFVVDGETGEILYGIQSCP